jgi:hypothetical protein
VADPLAPLRSSRQVKFVRAPFVPDQQASLSGDGPGYLVIRRQVLVKKGQWRMVSGEVEEAEGETRPGGRADAG